MVTVQCCIILLRHYAGFPVCILSAMKLHAYFDMLLSPIYLILAMGISYLDRELKVL